MIETQRIDTDKYKQLLEKKVGLGAKIQDFIKSDGFLILKAIFYNFEQDIKNERQPSWEIYNAKMEALKIVNGLFAELDSMVNDAEQAQEEIKKLIESENSTPLSLDGEGDEGQFTD